MAKARDYAHEYASYHGKPEQIKKRAQRVQARRDMEDRVGKAALKGKDVGHKTPIKAGGTNASSNLAVQSVKSNRGWRRGKSGY